MTDQLAALDATTTLVSMTIGGNDVGFASVLQDCMVHGTSTCVSDVNAAEDTARTVLPGRLDDLYSQLAELPPDGGGPVRRLLPSIQRGRREGGLTRPQLTGAPGSPRPEQRSL